MKSCMPEAWRGAVLGAALLSTSLVLGQTAQPPDAANLPEEEEVIVLSPFEVTTETDTGYVATDTLAGTRIRTELRDVGAAISVVTKELMTDIGATDNMTLLQYTTNAEVAGTHGTYGGLGNGATVDEVSRLLAPNTVNRIRGLSAAENTRDFFVTDIPWDAYNVDRVDIQRGPNSILFGLGKPAGLINAGLSNALFVDQQRLEARYGSYGSYRGSLSFNKELIDDVLAIRVAALYDREKFQQKPAFEDDERLFLAGRFDPRWFREGHTSLRVKYEHGEIDANRPRTVPPMDAVSPWFRPVEVSASNPLGGLGRVLIDNPYDAFSEYQAADGSNYLPWLTGANLNAQQPFWLLDGATGQVYDARAGWINNNVRRPDGSLYGTADGLPGRRYPTPFLGVGTLNNVATNLDLPLADYGQYRAQSMTDPGIFDFYHTLIDGPNKWEAEKWDAYNIDLTQTVLDDRLGVQLSYDHQNYRRSGESLLGWQPTITIDLLQRWDDLSVNPNAGRPYVATYSGGDGRFYDSRREYYRGSVYGELRATDFIRSEGWLTRLLGRHRLNGVYSKEDFQTEERSWIRKANDQTWAAFWNRNDGSSSPFSDRTPAGIIYLGDSLTGVSSASEAHIPGITSRIDLESGSVWLFDSTWTAANVPFDDPWTVPESLRTIFSEDPPQEEGYLQNSNPDNYAGWKRYPIVLWSYDNGADPRLTRNARLQQRETSSIALSWQGYWWNDAIVTTFGWREDEVKSRDYTAKASSYRATLDLRPDVYRLPDAYSPDRILKDESTSGGVVVHVNRLLGDRDPLPINVSLTYNRSNNFEVGNVRNDLYGNPIDNPSGKTEDFGVLLATKDNKYSFRVVKFESETLLDNSSLDSWGIGATISNGLMWRNIFLYDLGAYDWGTRDQPSYRNRASNAFPIDGPANLPYHVAEGSPEELALEDAMIEGWNEIQRWLTDKGFFEAWNFTPVDLSALTNRSTYAANPDAHVPPDTSKVTTYSPVAPTGFAVTADTLSKGYEFEFTANPLSGWRLMFNASKAEAFRNNVGGPLVNEFVEFMDSMLLDDSTANGYSAAGNLPRWGGAANAIGPSVYAPWRANYVRMKLQEGTAVPEMRKWRFNFITNYSFLEGRLKGFGVGGSYRWQDKVAIGYPLVPISNALYGFDIENPIYGPSEDFVDLWVSYERRLADKVNWKIQLNVRNAFADNGLIPISVEPDNTTWASVRMKPVQEWFVTNTFSF